MRLTWFIQCLGVWLVSQELVRACVCTTCQEFVSVCVCVCVCLWMDKSNYRALRGRVSESGGGQITQDNSPGRQLHALLTLLTTQMCWTDAAVMRCVCVCVCVCVRREKRAAEDRMKDAR